MKRAGTPVSALFCIEAEAALGCIPDCKRVQAPSAPGFKALLGLRP